MKKFSIFNFQFSIHDNRGVTLFIAIVIMGILLFISFAVVNIAIKSTIFASSGRDSQLAFYAADAGLECAIYWDTKVEPSKFASAGSTFSCGGYTIQDTQAIAGTSTLTSIGAGAPVYSPVVLRNAGGSAWGPDSQGLNWSADGGYSGGSSYSVSDNIDNTTDDVLYRSERWSSGTLTYNFSVANGPATVILKFAEIYFGSGRPGGGGAGSRVFDIEINDTLVENDFDPFVASGGALKAIDKQYAITVTGGNVKIEFIPVISNPKVSAIRIDVPSGGSSNYTSTFGFKLDQGVNENSSCAIVTVSKNITNGTTYIKSRGYNTCENTGRRIERGVEVTY